MTAAFADCCHLPCPACHAAVNDMCTFECNGHVFQRHAPCRERLVAADKAAGGAQ